MNNNISKITSIALLISGIFSQTALADVTNPTSDVTNEDVTVDNYVWNGNYTSDDDYQFHQIDLSSNSTWNGNLNISQGSSVSPTLNNSSWYGDITFSNTNSSASAYTRLENNSTWVGNITGDSRGTDVYVDAGSHWEGNITLASSGNIYAYAGVNDGADWEGNIDINANQDASSIVDFRERGSWTGGVTVTGSEYSSLRVYGDTNGKWTGDAEISGNRVDFNSQMNDQSEWHGNAILTGDAFIQADVRLDGGAKWEGNLIINPNQQTTFYGTLNTGAAWTGGLSITSKQINLRYELYNQNDWNGNAILAGDELVDAYLSIGTESNWAGDMNISSNQIVKSEVDVGIDALWDGNLTVSGNQITPIISIGGGKWHGNAILTGDESVDVYTYNYDGLQNGDLTITGKQIIFDTTLWDQAKWHGNAILTGDEFVNVQERLEYGSYLEGNQDIRSNNVLAFSAFLNNASAWVGDVTVSTGYSEDDTVYPYNGFNLQMYGNSSFTGDSTLSGRFGSANVLVYQSEWNGGLDLQNAILAYPSRIELNDNSTWRGYVADAMAQTMVTVTDSHWLVTGDTQIQQLDLTNGTLGFGDPLPTSQNASASPFHTLTIAGDMNYSSTTPVPMRTNLETFQGDLLVVNGDLKTDNDEALMVTVNNQGGAQIADPERELTIVQLAGAGAIELTNDVEVGAFLYQLKHEGNEWRLYTNFRYSDAPAPYTPVAEAAIDSMNAGYLLTFTETQTLMQRMGDLRGGQANGGAWARAFGGRFDISGTTHLPNGFDMDYAGVQVGIDRQLTLDNTGNLYLGGMFGASQSDQDYARGDGKITASHVGLYGTYVHPNGFYVDTLVKYTHMRHKDNPIDTLGQRQSAKASTDGFSGSVEVGQRLHLTDQATGWYVEPQFQVTKGRQSGADFHYSNGLRARFDAVDSLIGRTGVLVGYELKGGDTPVNLYAKASYVREFDGDVNVRFNNVSRQESFKGEWLSSGLGVTTQLAKRHHLYADLESNNGSRFDNLQFNMGYRFAF